MTSLCIFFFPFKPLDFHPRQILYLLIYIFKEWFAEAANKKSNPDQIHISGKTLTDFNMTDVFL